jgi:hypothetical protein
MPDSQTSFWTPARIGAVIGAVLLIVALAYLVSLPQNQFAPADLLQPRYAADLYEIPVEIIPEDALTLEQIERLDWEHDTDGFARALEEFVEEGAAGLGAALEIMLAEVEQECASRS